MKPRARPSAPPPPPVLTPALHRYLYLTAALTGAAIMIVEILGAKMLSPYVGMSHFVWTAQIAVTLMALAAGYYAGGRWADRSQNLNRLYWAIAVAAGYLVLTVLLRAPVAFWCLDFNLAVGSLLASTLLFFVPLALLAMTGPFLIRVLTVNVSGVGGNVGRLTAIGTLGSFFGTLCIGYLMLPLLANSTSMYLTAAALALVCGGYFACFQRSAAALATASLVVAGAGLLVPFGPAPKHPVLRERFRGNSYFGQLQVLDHPDGHYRIFANDLLVQNNYDPVSKHSLATFTYLLSGMARAYTTNLQDVLCIGLGIGIVPMEFARDGIRVDVVEINPAVVPMATRFFDLQPDKLNITIDDGRHFLNRCQRQYDAVLLDAFLGDSSPSHLMTREAFTAMRRVLRPGGVLVINVFCHTEAGEDFFAASLNRTLRSVFASVQIHRGGGQSYLLAMDTPQPQIVRPPTWSDVPPAILPPVKAAFADVVELPADSGMVLTDDFNPVEFYDAHNRELVRRQLALSSRTW